MNFDEAVSAHIKWKVRLRMCIDESEKLEPAVVCKDDQCELGKWIYGDGQIYKNALSYEPLRNEHARFHRCAGDVVRKVNAGDKSGAEQLLGAEGEFAQASQATIDAIMRMKREIA
jgi:hypothetical protein